MLKLFKGLRIAYFITALVGAFAIMIVGALLKYETAGSALGFVWIFLSAFFFVKRATKKYKDICRLIDNCEAYEFVAETERLLGGASSAYAKNVLRLNLYIGYRDINLDSKAEQAISSVVPDFPDNKIGGYSASLYYLNLAAYYSHKKEYEKCEAALETAKLYCRSEKLTHELRAALQNLLLNFKYSLFC